MRKTELKDIIQAVIDKEKADGCLGCAYEDTEEWCMPCSKCKRNCKDYYRVKVMNGGHDAETV